MFDLKFLKEKVKDFNQSSCKSFLFAGVDEVGRGPLAGPVVSAAVLCRLKTEGFEEAIFKKILAQLKKLEVGDSKRLSKKKRLEILASLNIDCAQEWQKWNKRDPLFLKRKVANFEIVFSLAFKDQRFIDEHNILQSALSSMLETLSYGRGEKVLALIDGNRVPVVASAEDWKCFSIVKGDQKSLLIALASIFAKEMRDFWMEQIDEEYPNYGLKKNAGYPTQDHLKALQKFGPCEYHRKSFRGVLQ